MKKILVLTVLMFGYYFQTYSQTGNSFQNKHFQIDTTFSDLSLRRNIENHNPSDLLGLNPSFRNPLDEENLISPELRDDSQSDQDQFSDYESPLNSYNMPLVELQGVFPMLIDRPDSTVGYTLRIKDF